jgi:4'-phosphopantetheinyl transferase EntD
MDHCSNPAPSVMDAIRRVLPAGLALAGGAIDAMTDPLFPVEALAVERAVEKRRHEFAAGRGYARAAMAQLGVPPLPIAVLPSRAPDWPAGVTGSISHAADRCVAVAGLSSAFAGVGVDIERATPLSTELHASVCGPEELAELPCSGTAVDPAKQLFVVKEAFFKLYHPVTGHFLEFLDVSVRLERSRGMFTLQLRDAAPALLGGRVFDGWCGLADNYLFALIALKA